MISSLNFSKKCDLVVCKLYSKQVHFNGTPKRLFITGEDKLFEQILHIMKSFDHKYELVYHCSDAPFDRYKFESIRHYVSHIYAENCEIDHPMITRLPLGFQDNKVPIRLDLPKDILCYLNVGIYNEQELQFVNCRSIRIDCIKHFEKKPFVTVESNIPQDEFMKRLNRAKFVVCPMGYGIDTFRFYEASYLGCTPIVISSGLDPLYRKYGALIVDSWDEITEERLINHVYTAPDPTLFEVDTFIHQ